MGAEKYRIDMCHGPLFGKILRFALPLIFTYVLQLLFNAADLVVIGHYASHKAMAAIGATMNLNSLVINIFIGLSIGSNVVGAKCFGARDFNGIRRALHTSMALAIYGGIALMVIAFCIAKPLLLLMKTPADILPLSSKYIWICFAGIPFIMIYNFGCAMLRAVGDTRRPLYYLICAGIVNVVMNLIFVIGFGMDVAGVAVATWLSHAISALLIFRALLLGGALPKLVLRKIGIDRETLKEILHIGIPAGLQASCFAVSNMLIQSSINSFGSYAIAGNTACIGLEGLIYTGSYAFHQTTISCVAQNLGGKQYSRIGRSIVLCMICAMANCTVFGFGFYFFSNAALGLFNPDPQVIQWGVLRMKILFTTYVTCGVMDAASGALRGLGYSILSTSVCLGGVCLYRTWWVVSVFPRHRTMEFLLWCYPISWSLAGIIGTLCVIHFYRKLLHTQDARKVEWSAAGPGVPRGYRSLGGPK